MNAFGINGTLALAGVPMLMYPRRCDDCEACREFFGTRDTMKVRELLDKIDFIAPWALAEDWDNVGLMVGNPEMEVNRLAVALDPLPEAMEEAHSRGCQALLSHHPLFFSPLKTLDFSATSGKVVEMAARLGMAVLSAHTNWDVAEGGVSRVLADRLGLVGVMPLAHSASGGGMGAVGDLPAAAPVCALNEILKERWGLKRLDFYGSMDCCILRVALCGGSGGNLWPSALSSGAELYVTADMKYHDILECARSNIAVAVVDHAEMESASLSELARRLAIPDGPETVLTEYRALGVPVRV